MNSEPIPVLIVGAGPTGLMMACELARRGVACRVVDKAPERSPWSKALAVHARTLELLDNMGVAEELIERGVRLSRGNVRSEGDLLATISFEDLDTPFPFVLSVPQTETEAVLERLFERLGGKVERGVEFVGFYQNLEAAESTLRHADGREEKAWSRWLIGCDGCHSAVRTAADIPFPGHRETEVFGLADAKIDWELPGDSLNAFFSEEGVAAVIPMPGGMARVIASLGPDAPDDNAVPPLAEFQDIMDRRAGVPCKLSKCAWTSWFRVYYRLAGRYREGRAFLAGDAAHVHSPVGGVGMNTGLQDAFNLAWKLALVENERGLLDLLDSYEAERRPVAEAILSGTEAATRAVALRAPLARKLRNAAARFLTGLDAVQRKLAGNASAIGLGYRGSPVVAEKQDSFLFARAGGAPEADETPNLSDWRRFHGAPHAGDRAPDGWAFSLQAGKLARLFDLLRDGRHALLLFDGEAETPQGYKKLIDIGRAVEARWGKDVSVHLVLPREEAPEPLEWTGSTLLDPEGGLEHRYGAGAECLYLIRPDGHVAFRSQPADGDALLEYLQEFVLLH